MSAPEWLLVGTVITALVGLAGTYLLIKQQGRQTKTSDTQQLIDQLQEERDAADRRRAEADAKHGRELADVRRELADVRSRVDGLEDRELAWSDYAAKLRDHIDRRLGPPPPAWPAALLRRRPT